MKISKRSSVILKGKGASLSNLEVDGHFVSKNEKNEGIVKNDQNVKF